MEPGTGSAAALLDGQRPLGGFRPGALGCAKVSLGTATCKVAGIIVKDSNDFCTIGIPAALLTGLPPEAVVDLPAATTDDTVKVGIVHVRSNHVKGAVPDSWGEDYIMWPVQGRHRPDLSHLKALAASFPNENLIETPVVSSAEDDLMDQLKAMQGEIQRLRAAAAAGVPAASSSPTRSTSTPAPKAPVMAPELLARAKALWAEPELDEEEDSAGGDSPEMGFSPGLDIQRMLEAHTASGGVPPSMFEVIQIMMLKEMSRGRASSSRDEDGGRPSGIAKAVSGMHHHRQRLRNHPKQFITEFRELVKDELSVKVGEPWAYKDISKKIPWGKMKSLQRCFLLDCAVMELLETGDVTRAQALLGQSMKAKWQVALNNGNWRVAWPLTGEPDPLSRRPFAGTEAELEIASGWVKALDELQKRTGSFLKPTAEASSDEDHSEDSDKKKGKNNKKKKDKKDKGAGKGAKTEE